MQLHTNDRRRHIVDAIRAPFDGPYYFFSRCIRHTLALLWNIPRYAKKLGCIRGFYTLLASDLSIGVFRVKVPGISGALNIRPRTSDRYVFEQIFVDDDYARRFATSFHSRRWSKSSAMLRTISLIGIRTRTSSQSRIDAAGGDFMTM